MWKQILVFWVKFREVFYRRAHRVRLELVILFNPIINISYHFCGLVASLANTTLILLCLLMSISSLFLYNYSIDYWLWCMTNYFNINYFWIPLRYIIAWFRGIGTTNFGLESRQLYRQTQIENTILDQF